MSCVEKGYTISIDENDRLKGLIKEIADGNKTKEILLASYFNNDVFIKHIKDITNVENILDISDDIIKEHAVNYFNKRIKSVNNHIEEKTNNSLQGFTSSNVVVLAKDTTANNILDIYYRELDDNKKLNKDKVIELAKSRIFTNFETNYCKDLIDDLKTKDNIDKSIINSYESLMGEIKDLKNEYKTLLKKHKDKIIVKEEIHRLKNVMSLLMSKNNKKLDVLLNLTDKYGNKTQKDYKNLVIHLRNNTKQWFSEVFELGKMYNVSNEFKQTIENYETNDEVDELSVDEESSRWTDDTGFNKDFMDNVGQEMNTYFDRLYNIIDTIEEDGNRVHIYDTNNELGVPTTMNAKYVISQISNYGSFYSIKDFKDSINKIANNIPSLYGLRKLVDDMNNDHVFAMKVFHNLANPKIKKVMITIKENGISIDQSNKSVEPLACMLYDLINVGKSSMRDNFKASDYEIISDVINDIKSFEDEEFVKSYSINDYRELTINTMFKYFPHLSEENLRNYLNYETDNTVNRYVNLLSGLSEFLESAEYVIAQENEAYASFTKSIAVYKEKQQQYEQAMLPFNEKIPIYSNDNVEYEKLNFGLIHIAKALVDYIPVKNELNSVNAEGNLGSDLIANTFITNTIKQIQYGTIDNPNLGLQKLLDFVSKNDQFNYSTIFFGIKDDKGNTIQDGIFIKKGNNYSINDKAKEILTPALFSGISDMTNGNSALYNNMSKSDYFLSNLIASMNNIKYKHTDFDFANYFLQTPSDASKNFMVQMPHNKSDRIWSNSTSKENEYISNVIEKIYSYNNVNSEGNANIDNILLQNESKYKKNISNLTDLYDIITKTPANINYANKYNFKNIDGSVEIPFIYKKGNDIVIVMLKGDKIDGDNNTINNVIISEIYTSSFDKNGKAILPSDFILANRKTIVEEGKSNGSIKQNINKDSILYRGFYQNVYGELNNFIRNLNNLFVEKDGQFVLKKDTKGLIDNYHIKKGKLIKDGKLTGSVFNFNRLFETNDFNLDKELKALLGIYEDRGNKRKNRDKALIIKNAKGDYVLNLKRSDLFIKDGDKLKLNIDKENVDIIHNVVEQWVSSYGSEILERTKQFEESLDNRYESYQIQDAIMRLSLAQMGFVDIFYNDSKFYKDAQTFLKRAKEIQAGGKAYGLFDFSDDIGGIIQELYDDNNEPISVKYNKGNKVIKINNGFKGVTIYNSEKASVRANDIYNEVYNINKETLGKKQADNIAKKIAEGYGYIKGDDFTAVTTSTNDAQSYITLDEFVKRKYADGTLNEYKDILEQLYDPNIKVEDIDLSKINARIQVQKNFYFDQQYDAETDTIYPRQIKNAEYVLIPKLIKGTSLEKLHDLAIKNGIGQINTIDASKAANKDILTFWDNNGELTKENEELFAEQIANNTGVESYYYKYLYKQQDVASHLKDEHNKAGIQIMKKILDNAILDEETVKHIKSFSDNYCANIKADFNTLLENMGWKQDSDGNFINKDNNSKDLDFTGFYERARKEAQRLNPDSNFMDYLTPNELGHPTMPNFMNNVSTKLESIAQAIFNNAITRQTLPGWHGAQISNVGYDESLKYHPAVENEKGEIVQESYAEVRLPRWSNIIPKGYDISKLAKEGLDIHLGYRIPTEGKQSVSILKVVGFLDDVYDSTIVVPDEWVTQTGSDFDVDSVYGICYEMYKDRNGIVRKIQFDKGTTEKDVRRRYNKYVNSKLNERVNKDVLSEEEKKSHISDLVEEIRDINKRKNNSKEFAELVKLEKEVRTSLPVEGKRLYSSYMSKNKHLSYKEKMDMIAGMFETEILNTKDDVVKEKYQQMVDVVRSISDIINQNREINKNDTLVVKSKIKDRIKSLYDKINEDYNKKIERFAEESDIMSFDEFSELSLEEQNTRKARNNEILNSMISIMESVHSREENYSRSNFKDLVDAKDVVDGLRKHQEALDGNNTSKDKSAYNPLDQIDFMENAVSGMMLKAFSVTRDTFNSVNNYIKSELSKRDSITVEYVGEDYDFDTISSAYDNVQTKGDKEKQVITVTHNRLGCSKNNRNVLGEYVTTYSSQTTAHILDAIKEGAIHNENDYTFGVFKTFIDTGIDYKTAILFLQQPAVTRLVENYFRTKSIYTNSNTNPINESIKNIATELGIVVGGKPITSYTPIEYVKNALMSNNNFKNAFIKAYGSNTDLNNITNDRIYTINNKLLENRFNYPKTYKNFTKQQDVVKYNIAVHDIVTLLNFEKIKATTTRIEKLARVSNPDKFGAKQTIRATREKVENAINYMSPTNDVYGTLTVGGKQFIEAIYPNIENGNIEVNKQAYPYLGAFMQYATIPSIKVNSQLFSLEREDYVNVSKYVQEVLGIRFNELQYKEYKSFIVSNLYNTVSTFTTPYIVDENGMFVEDETTIIENSKNNTDYWNVERSRLFGYDTTESIHIDIKDINNPTKEELIKFNKLTPAQKVLWMQANFKDNAGIFDFLKVNLFNQYEQRTKGFTSQTIKFNDQVENMEDLYIAFRNCFFNKNNLVKLASLDLIKYAFIVEGFKFKKGAISRIITNDSLLADIENKGLDIIANINRNFALFSDPRGNLTKSMINKFVRSHSEYVREVVIPSVKSKSKNKSIAVDFNRYIKGQKLSFIPYEESSEALLNHLIIDSNSMKDYIRITRRGTNRNKTTDLYKIVRSEDGVYLYPLNLLEKNEVSDYSANRKNNIHKTEKYYENFIREAIKAKTIDNTLIDEFVGQDKWKNYLKDVKREYNIPVHKSSKVNESVENVEELMRIAEHGTSLEQNGANNFINDIRAYFDLSVEDRGKFGVITSGNRAIQYAFPTGQEVEQLVPMKDGSIKRVRISTYNKPSYDLRKFRRNNKNFKEDGLFKEEISVYKNILESNDKKSPLYKIEQVTDEEVAKRQKTIQDEIDNQRNVNKEGMYAITNIIEDVEVNSELEYEDVDAVTKDIYNDIARRDKLDRTVRSEQFMNAMYDSNVDRFSAKSIKENKKDVLVGASKYYINKAQELLYQINNFETMTGDKFKIDSVEMFEHLKTNPEDYIDLVKLILESATFGKQFNGIFDLNLRGETIEITNAINKIKEAISSVRNNNSLKNARVLIFNDYLANKYSTNPLVKHGIIDLRTQFGDTDFFDLHFSDIGELNNKQVQTVLKYVMGKVNEANKITAPKKVDEFLKEFERIENKAGSFSLDNIITKEGRIVKDYTEDFIKTRESIIKELAETKEMYGINSVEYEKAKLKKYDFLANNEHQEAVKEYYIKRNNNIRNILNNFPQAYIKYMTLIRELYNENKELSKQEDKERRKKINNEINELINFTNNVGEFKTENEVNEAVALRKFIETKKEINEKYYEYIENDSFNESLQYYLNVIKKYNIANPHQVVSDKLKNTVYKEAVEWVEQNTIHTVDEESRKKIYKAFNDLKDTDNSKNSKIDKIVKLANAYDEDGKVNPFKLSKEDVAKIKELNEHKFSWTYESNAGEAILIKEVPNNLPVLSDKFYRAIRTSNENDAKLNKERLEMVGEINKLLSKAVDGVTGEIKTKDLFEKLTKEELGKLIYNYKYLHKLKMYDYVDGKPKHFSNFSKHVEYKVNKPAFNRELSYAKANFEGTKQWYDWLDIFVAQDKDGNPVVNNKGNYIPNGNIFGYFEAKDDTYIDSRKTEARNIIEDNIEYEPTKYYYEAVEKATKDGNFDEWYKANHVFNPYTHKTIPLPIWTTMKIKSNGSLNAKYDYYPTFENKERKVKDQYKNDNFRKGKITYDTNSGNYNNLTTLSSKEKEVRDLLLNTVEEHATTYNMKKFVEKGFLPRRRVDVQNSRWYGKQALAFVGLEYGNTNSKEFTDEVDYTTDKEDDFDMLQLLKTKGYKERVPMPIKGTYDEAEYLKRVEDVKKQNKKIDEDNLKLDNSVLDRDWKNVFVDYINKAVEFNTKQEVKNTLYLLLEDLKHNPAYKINSWSGNLKQDKNKSTREVTKYQTEENKNTQKLVETFVRRYIKQEFKKDSKLNGVAGLLQNMTSAKYMIFNVTGGISNITTGWNNILGEKLANTYFDKGTLLSAQSLYFGNMINFMSDMYSPTTNNFAVGLTKFFDVIDFDSMSERRPNESTTKYVKRVRDLGYSLQSGGEHYMQNMVLFSILQSNRVYTDSNGETKCGNVNDYNWEIEIQTLMKVMSTKDDMLQQYKIFIKSIKDDVNDLRKYDTFTKNFNTEFIKGLENNNEIAKEYIAELKIAKKQAKKQFEKNPLVIDQFELKEGVIKVKPDSKLTGEMIGQLTQRVISVNKKIHGVYDKIGAGRIEQEWWGGLVMQYHKHLYPGVMKRLRTKGYYNEIRQSVEKGSYVSTVRLLATEFDGVIDKSKKEAKDENSNVVVKSVQNIIKAGIDTVYNIRMNYNLMSDWEKANVRRSLADIISVTTAVLGALLIHLGTDDDELKESDTLSLGLYLMDRLASESQAYTPWGAYGEAKTLWGSPVAFMNSPADLFKGFNLISQWMFDDDFNPNYTTGRYKGENKASMLIRRNTPIVRVIDRLNNMSKHNKYYRLNENALSFIPVKDIADSVNPD